jgi:hypothetical protein
MAVQNRLISASVSVRAEEATAAAMRRERGHQQTESVGILMENVSR